MPLQYHTFNDTSNLPSNVVELVRRLDRPLPDVKSAIAQYLSQLAVAQLHKLPDAPSNSSYSADTNDKLPDVLDAVLVASAGVAELAGDNLASIATVWDV